MDKKNVISLVLGLVIGALVIWLVMAFTPAGSTMILKYSGKNTPTPTPTTTASTGAANIDLSKVKTVDGVSVYTLSTADFGDIEVPLDADALNTRLGQLKNLTADEIRESLAAGGVTATTIHTDSFWKWLISFFVAGGDIGKCQITWNQDPALQHCVDYGCSGTCLKVGRYPHCVCDAGSR